MSSNQYTYGRNDTFGTEIDYGDIPENMDEARMRAYLALESKIVIPNQNQNDSFEQQWKDGRKEYIHNNKQQYPSKPNYNYKDSQTEALSNVNNNNTNDRNRNNTNTTMASSVYPDSTAYHDHIMDTTSTITMIPQKNTRTQHSFKKQQVLNQNNNRNNNHHINNHHHPHHHHQPRDIDNNQNQSALTAQIAPQKHQLGNEKQDGVGVIQSRNGSGLLVIKQMPYSKKTHVSLHIFVEIKPDHIEHIIVYFQKHFSVKQFLNLLKNGTNNAMFNAHELQIFCADEDGDLDDDFPAPEPNAIIANLGLSNFYIKLSSNELNDEQRDELRRTTLHHKQHLKSEEEMDREYNVDESESSEYEEDYDDDSGCKCSIL